MGSINGIIGWFFFTEIGGLLWCVLRRSDFVPQIRGLLCSVPRRGFFLLFTCHFEKMTYFVKKMMSGHFLLENDDVWSDFVIFPNFCYIGP